MHTVGIIGAGLQARRRIPAIMAHADTKVVAITSQSRKSAQLLAEKFAIPFYPDWKKIVADKTIESVLVATYPDTHAVISITAMKHGKHVLSEKPLAKNVKEAELMLLAARKYKKILKCGFNHRFHPAVFQAKELVETGKIGKLLFGRGVYGHCGRAGFEHEWRTNPQHSAGGILIEQGIHLIDIFRWFFGEFSTVSGITDTLYFPIKPFEDSAFVLLKTNKNQTVSIHSTNLQWKNTFLFEVYGTEGYVKVEGLGASYGTEKLIIGKKTYTGPFQEEVLEFRGDDQSWGKEWEEFTLSIETMQQPLGDGKDGLEALKIVEGCYRAAKAGKTVVL